MRPSRPFVPRQLVAAAAVLSLLALPAVATGAGDAAAASPAGSATYAAPAAGPASTSARTPGTTVAAPQAGGLAEAGLARRRAIITRWSGPVAKRGQRGVLVRGRLTRRGVRSVLLQVRTGPRWRTVQVRRTTRFGAYRLVLPTRRVGLFTYRVVAPVSARQRRRGMARAVSAPRRLRVVAVRRAAAPPRPAGDPADHTTMIDQAARWNPCKVIDYRVNTTHGPPSALKDTLAAAARIERATGLDLNYVGSTSLIPQHQQEAFPKGTRIVIAWASRSQSAMISSDSVAGVGGPVGWGSTVDRNGDPIITWQEGTVVLNSAFNDALKPGFGTGVTVGKLLMHEIGHVVGLGHARGREQIMYPTLLHDTPTAWGAGDLTGLRSQGASQGCIYQTDGALARMGRTAVYSELTADTLADLRR